MITLPNLKCLGKPLRRKRPYLELFWSVFSPHGGNTDQNNFEYRHFLRSELKQISLLVITWLIHDPSKTFGLVF